MKMAMAAVVTIIAFVLPPPAPAGEWSSSVPFTN